MVINMALFDNITKKAAKMGEDFLDRSQELADNLQLQLKVKNLEADCDDVYKDLGKYCYRYLKTHPSHHNEVIRYIEEIEDYEKQINDIKKMIDEE